MRPTPAEVITGVRRILKDVVEPAVSSDYASNALNQVRAVLAQVDWNDSSTALAVESRALSELAQQGMDWIGAAEGRRARFGVGLEQLRMIASAEENAFAGFDERNARVESFARVLVEFHADLTEWNAAHPGDADAPSAAIEQHFARIE